MRKFGEITSFTVVSFNPASICGGVFNLRAGNWRLTRTATRKLAGAKDESALWRELRRELHGGGELILLTGAIPGGVFFTLDTVALPPREQRDALMMELPRRLLSLQDDPVLQFLPTTSPDESAETESLNVYSVERKSLETAVAPLRRGHLHADEFVHPLLMTRPGDPAAYLPGLDPDFWYRDRSFHRVGDAAAKLAAEEEWRKLLSDRFAFDVAPADFAELFPVLLVARGVIAGDLRRHRKELQMLPKEVRQVRFRGQLRLTAVLVAALVAVLGWRFVSSRWGDFQEYRRIVAKTKRLTNETKKMKKASSNSAKQKEMDRVLSAVPEGRDALTDLAEISKRLPDEVMVTLFRWNEDEILLALQSENEGLDLTAKFAPRWKTNIINQNTARNSPITSITARLVPADKMTAKKGRNGKNGKKNRGK